MGYVHTPACCDLHAVRMQYIIHTFLCTYVLCNVNEAHWKTKNDTNVKYKHCHAHNISDIHSNRLLRL